MKNNQKNTLFLSSALQDSLNRISHMYDGYLQTIFSSDSITSQIGQLQEEMVKSYKHFFQLYTPSIISSLTNSLSIMSEAMTAAVRDNITTNMYNNLSESLKTMISLQSLQQQLIDTSSSSEAEAIKELQKTVEEQNKQYSQNQDTCLSVEEDNDNSKLTKDTDTPK